jgi:hypothetical protein
MQSPRRRGRRTTLPMAWDVVGTAS